MPPRKKVLEPIAPIAPAPVVRTRQSSNVFTTVIIVAIVAFLSAGAVYLRQNQILQDQQNQNQVVQADLNQQITTLQSQLAALQPQVNNNASTTLDASGRPIASAANFTQLFANETTCPVFQTNAATTTSNYKNTDWGFSVDLPYSGLWGNDKYAVVPADEFTANGQAGVAFGPVTLDSSCRWTRTDSLILTHDTSTIDQLLAAVKANNKQASNFTKTTVNQRPSLEYQQTVNNFTSATLIYSGSKAKYIFSTPCNGNDCSAALKYVEGVASTIKSLSTK